MQDWHAVKKLYDKGVPKKQIAKQLKMSKNTVKRLLALDGEPVYRRERSPTKVDDYKDIIRIWYLDGEYAFIGTRIFNELVKRGYTGTINPIYRYLKTLDAEKGQISRKATVRFETPPGDQAQFDWAEYIMDIGGKKTKIYSSPWSSAIPGKRRPSVPRRSTGHASTRPSRTYSKRLAA